jgi:N-glycosylase/DNA lyase
MANIVWLLRQTDDSLHYKVIGELPYPEDDVPAPPKKKNKQTSVASDNSIIVRMKVSEPKRLAAVKDCLYPDDYYEKLLTKYFRLDVNLEDFYAEWMAAHDHFKTNASQFYAVRMLDQDPVENLISFICSQNNNIAR